MGNINLRGVTIVSSRAILRGLKSHCLRDTSTRTGRTGRSIGENVLLS